MRDYFGDWPPGYKPSDKEQMDRATKEHNDKNAARKEGAGHYAKELKQTGPAERAYAQNGPLRQSEEKTANRPQQQPELTPVQQDMRTKREAARAEAQRQIDTEYSDKKYPILAKKPEPPTPSR